MAYADQQMSGSRIFAIVIVALIHVTRLEPLPESEQRNGEATQQPPAA